MEREDIRKAMLEIILSVSPDTNEEDIKDDVPLRDHLDLDSMDFLDIVMELRKRYKIEVPKEDYHNLSTINKSIEYLTPKFN